MKNQPLAPTISTCNSDYIDSINSLDCCNLIINLNTAQMSIELRFSLTFSAPYIKANVNHIVVTRHVSSPIDSELIDDCCFARFSVTEKYSTR
jgi:hypothetical protein